ncbi:unnamed protein product [Cuscuta epithymum]|uniref:Retrotransposon gag domain-containing protein n=1 Tax=Cuscuta epithymum TaxID=186058 RepID=A0AAV0CTW9_9ASTE|nr:unnamed protein product [Cuscuta epithymum]
MKVDLLMFTGDDADSWIVKMEEYFRLKATAEKNKVVVAEGAMEERALAWFPWWYTQTREKSWKILKEAINRRFQQHSRKTEKQDSGFPIFALSSKSLSQTAFNSLSSRTISPQMSSPSQTASISSQVCSLKFSPSSQISAQSAFPMAQVSSYLKESPEDTFIKGDGEQENKTSVVNQSIAMEYESVVAKMVGSNTWESSTRTVCIKETEEIEENESNSENKEDKIEMQNQNNSSAGFDSLSYDQGSYSEHLKVADNCV